MSSNWRAAASVIAAEWDFRKSFHGFAIRGGNGWLPLFY
jgi:hypothetical protein